MGFALVAVMAFGAMAGGAAAHASSDHGEITLHDEPEGPATTEIECEFWVQGHNMTHEEGTVRLHHHQADHSNSTTLGDWEADDGEFEAGPFRYDGGDWGAHRVSARMDGGNHSTDFVEMDYTECEDLHPPDCPQDVQAHAREDGSVELTWNASEDAEKYRVYRADSGEDRFDERWETENTSFTDTTTEPENTYEYMVVGVNENGETQDCDRVEVTAIPFFGNPALVAMAALGSVGAVAAVRVRRG